MNTSTFKRLALGVACLLGAGSANAELVTYSDRTNWDSAISAIDTVDFEYYTGSSTLVSPSYTTAGVNFSVSSGQLYLDGPQLTYDAAYLTGSYLEWQNSGDMTLTITLPSAVSAVGFDVGDFYGDVRSFAITVDGVTTNLSSTANAYTFFGAVGSSAFSSLSFTVAADANFPVLDNLTYGNAAAIPEPVTLALLGLGLAGLGFCRRRKA